MSITVARIRRRFANMMNVRSGRYLMEFVSITVARRRGNVAAMMNVRSGPYLMEFVPITVARINSTGQNARSFRRSRDKRREQLDEMKALVKSMRNASMANSVLPRDTIIVLLLGT